MIVDVPTPNEFRTAGLNQIYLAWQIAMGAVQTYDSALAWGAEDGSDTRDEYWRRNQPALANAYSLIQQGMELAIKGRIAEVSPFVLLGDPGRWTASAATTAVSFGEFRTLDATDLVKVHNCLCQPALAATFTAFWDEVRRERNVIMHSATPRSFDPADVLRTILIGVEALFADIRWARRLLEMEEENSVGAFGYHDNLQNAVMGQVENALRHLTPQEARRFFGFDPRKHTYLCPVCYQHANHDVQDTWPHLAQLAGAGPGETALTCIVCESASDVERRSCLYPSCPGDVIAEDQCLTCTFLQSHWFGIDSGLVDPTLGRDHVYDFAYGKGEAGRGGHFAADRQPLACDADAQAHGAIAMAMPHLQEWTTVSIAIKEGPPSLEYLPRSRVLGHWRRNETGLIWIAGASAYLPELGW